MTYAAKRDSIARTPIYLVQFRLDYCQQVFGTTPCLASGTKCFNTRATCKYTPAWTQLSGGKLYRFTSANAPAPWNTGERPYLESIEFIATEITEVKTIVGRVTVTLRDEPDNDYGIDPYVTSRGSVQGTFWRKLLARNPNYFGRVLEIWEGFAGDAEGEFQQRFKGKIQNITYSGGMATIEATDKIADLTKIDIPAKVDLRLRLDATAAATEINVTDISKLSTTSGYVRIEDEIISYAGVVTISNQLTGCVRALFGTIAAAHSANEKVQPCRFYSKNRPNSIIGQLLLDAGLALGEFDAAGLSTLDQNPLIDVPPVQAIISEPTKVSDLMFELLWHLDAQAWVAEDLVLKFARKVPNYGGRSYGSLTDDANIVANSVAVDLQDSQRISRITVYWDESAIADREEPAWYSRLDRAIDADMEGPNWYNDVRDDVYFSRWWNPTLEEEDVYAKKVANFLLRQVWRRRHSLAAIDLEVERKDSDLMTGSFLRVTTGELSDTFGNDLVGTYQVVKRERIGNQGARLKLQRLSPARIGFIAPNTSPDYASASADDKEYAFISNNAPNEGRMADDTDGYYII